MSGQRHRGPVQSSRRSAPEEHEPATSKRGVGFYVRNLVICALTVVAVVYAPTVLRAVTDVVGDTAVDVKNCQSSDCFILIP